MNSQREIYQALLDGETLAWGENHTSRLDEKGFLVDGKNKKEQWYFSTPKQWQIYKEPKWYESIPEGGVLCWCGTSKSLRLIESFVLESSSPDLNARPVFRTKDYDEGDWWWICKPLTKAEIQIFLDNANG